MESLTWIKNHFLVKEGYTLESIEKMEPEQYDYLCFLILELKRSGKTNSVPEGI